jgi:hypothetical protein
VRRRAGRDCDVDMASISVADGTAAFARIALASGVLALLACAGPHALGQESKATTMTITTSAFAPNGAIPALYTREGRDASPQLA